MRSLIAAFAFMTVVSVQPLNAKGPAYANPEEADADFAIQGEYSGEVADGIKVGTQVIARGNGKFDIVGYPGGLPGAGWNGENKFQGAGTTTDDGVVFEGANSSGIIKDGVLTVTSADGNEIGQLSRVERKSPTLGAKPPEGATILFDGSNADRWKNGKMTDDGLLVQGTTSQDKFQDHHLHIEFRLPYQPEDRGQARGNSGIYLQGRYEVQMLDSFGLEGKDNECGGIYEIKDTDVNMCLPPLAWQTYDIDFKAAHYNNQGDVVENPRITVRHNGVVIHEDVELPRSTRAAPGKPGPEPGPVYLQNHGNPVRYRNIWVVAKDEE